MEIDPKVLEEVKKASVDHRLTCTEARSLAQKLGVPPRVIGQACNMLGIKIKACELGCF